MSKSIVLFLGVAFVIAVGCVMANLYTTHLDAQALVESDQDIHEKEKVIKFPTNLKEPKKPLITVN